MKYLLLLVLFAVIWWSWKKGQVGASSRPKPGAEMPPENMLVCCHCGVHQPESSCLKDGGKVYCCEAHRQAAQSARR